MRAIARWCILAIFILPCESALAGELAMVARDRHIELSNATQRVCLTRSATAFSVDDGCASWAAWEPLFDGRRPLIEGSRFNLEPTSYAVLEDSPVRKAILLKGAATRRITRGIPWLKCGPAPVGQVRDYLQSSGGSEDRLSATDHRPVVNQATAAVTLDQGPVSQTGEAYRVPFNFGFPAAYLWDRQREAVIFFNMSPMTWFSPWGIHRFLDIQIGSKSYRRLDGPGASSPAQERRYDPRPERW